MSCRIPECPRLRPYAEPTCLEYFSASGDGPVNDFLFTYLDSIDEHLLEYLDEDDELKLGAVKRLRFYTTALLEGSITPDHVMEDWPDWYQLASAFMATYGTEELQELEGGAEFLDASEAWRDMYPEMRTTEE